MNQHGIMYTFEHRLLPHFFFTDKIQFIGSLLQDKALLFNIINEIFQNEGVENPYHQEDFDLDASKVTDDVFILKIIYPEPEEEPLCYCSYLFFDEEFEKTSYFCIEKGNSESKDYPFVCSWTADGTHRNHGKCSFDKHNDFIRCVQIHMDEFYKG